MDLRLPMILAVELRSFWFSRLVKTMNELLLVDYKVSICLATDILKKRLSCPKKNQVLPSSLLSSCMASN